MGSNQCKLVLEIEDSQIPFALVHALETDDILQFEDLFQRITSLSAPQAARAMYDLGMEGLAIACKAVDIERAAFGRIFCHLHGQRPFAKFRETTKFTNGMAFFDATKRENALRILEEWRAADQLIGDGK